jgi:Flp pilus assembly protein TadB
MRTKDKETKGNLQKLHAASSETSIQSVSTHCASRGQRAQNKQTENRNKTRKEVITDQGKLMHTNKTASTIMNGNLWSVRSLVLLAGLCLLTALRTCPSQIPGPVTLEAESGPHAGWRNRSAPLRRTSQSGDSLSSTLQIGHLESEAI